MAITQSEQDHKQFDPAPKQHDPDTGEHVFKFGYSSILVPDSDFADGYSEGYTSYPLEDQEPLTPQAIRQLMVELLIDTSCTADFNTGYLVGKIRAIYESNACIIHMEQEVPRVSFGDMTLHLDHVPFHDAYYTGVTDYNANFVLRQCPGIIAEND